MPGATGDSYVDLIESSGSDLPPVGTTRIVRQGGVTKQSVDGTAFAALGSGGGFGPDVTVNLPNSISANVKALELVAALTTNTASSEVSSWTASVLVAGAQVAAFVATGAAFQMPVGTIALPGMSFIGHAGSGLAFDTGTSGVFLSVGGLQQMGFLGAGAVVMQADASHILMGTATQGFFGMLGLDASVSSNLGNLSIGPDGAVATNSATLHMLIPTCAGSPTGTVVPRSGKAALIYDSTNFQEKVSLGSGTWRLPSGATTAANGAVASVMTANVGPTGANTAIQRWRKEPDGAGGFWLTPSWL